MSPIGTKRHLARAALCPELGAYRKWLAAAQTVAF
jgi:hypothetical protein